MTPGWKRWSRSSCSRSSRGSNTRTLRRIHSLTAQSASTSFFSLSFFFTGTENVATLRPEWANSVRRARNKAWLRSRNGQRMFVLLFATCRTTLIVLSIDSDVKKFHIWLRKNKFVTKLIGVSRKEKYFSYFRSQQFPRIVEIISVKIDTLWFSKRQKDRYASVH